MVTGDILSPSDCGPHSSDGILARAESQRSFVPVSAARACAYVADGRSVEVHPESRLFNSRTGRHKDGVVIDGQNLVSVCLHGEILSIWVRGTKMCLRHAYNEVQVSNWKIQDLFHHLQQAPGLSVL